VNLWFRALVSARSRLGSVANRNNIRCCAPTLPGMRISKASARSVLLPLLLGSGLLAVGYNTSLLGQPLSAIILHSATNCNECSGDSQARLLRCTADKSVSPVFSCGASCCYIIGYTVKNRHRIFFIFQQDFFCSLLLSLHRYLPLASASEPERQRRECAPHGDRGLRLQL